MDFSLIIIFWYGILHAFGPDHLTAIADFSIGKDSKKTMLITVLFAIGHGISLFIFAKILQSFNISQEILSYGDTISAAVILGMGIYLFYIVATDKIQLKKHIHNGKEHIHIWFGKEHSHDDTVAKSSSFTMGLLMGAGGVRGMLVTLGAVGSGNVNLTMVLSFTLGVMVIFVGFGVILAFLNKNILTNKKNLKGAFSLAALVSILVGSNMLFASDPIHGHSHGAIHTHNIGQEATSHRHNFANAQELVNSKRKSDMTYKQMMQQMGEAFKLMQTGVLTQNKELVKSGADMIQNHPAPNHKPWTIMRKSDQAAFKATLIEYDKLLHGQTDKIIKSLKINDWFKVNSEVSALSNHCVSCHSSWQNKTIK